MTTQAVPTIQAAAAAGAIAGLPASKPAYGKETAQVVLDIIRLNPEHHNQGHWDSDCGTTRCVAGWVAYIHPELLPAHGLRDMAFPRAGRCGLDISNEDSEKLFWTMSEHRAIHALEYLAKGEPIDWQAVRNS
jgi:hypothetical protein